MLYHLCIDKRIAITVATNPTANAEKTRQIDSFSPFGGDAFFQTMIERGQCGKKGQWMVGDAVFNFISYIELKGTDFAGLPQCDQNPLDFGF